MKKPNSGIPAALIIFAARRLSARVAPFLMRESVSSEPLSNPTATVKQPAAFIFFSSSAESGFTREFAVNAIFPHRGESMILSHSACAHSLSIVKVSALKKKFRIPKV